ncbi:MAG: hypothetical protein K2O42_11285 [Oscillospiraceae bacterium]|nr:hypothetical protein [Oscillospiraceae bacterium]
MKWYEKYEDPDFVNYCETGEAAAVHVVRDCAEEITTTGKWIDVISINTFESQFKGRIGFNWIIVELFPRIHQPEYTDDRDENRYLTWHTAHEDIAEHRSKNHHGEKFLVLCKLKRMKRIINEKEKESIDYHVIDTCKVNQRQIHSITTNAAEIVANIQAKQKPSLALFQL